MEFKLPVPEGVAAKSNRCFRTPLRRCSKGLGWKHAHREGGRHWALRSGFQAWGLGAGSPGRTEELSPRVSRETPGHRSWDSNSRDGPMGRHTWRAMTEIRPLTESPLTGSPPLITAHAAISQFWLHRDLGATAGRLGRW